MKEERINNMCGGEGYVTIRHLLSDHEQALNKKITLYAAGNNRAGTFSGLS